MVVAQGVLYITHAPYRGLGPMSHSNTQDKFIVAMISSFLVQFVAFWEGKIKRKTRMKYNKSTFCHNETWLTYAFSVTCYPLCPIILVPPNSKFMTNKEPLNRE